MTIHDVELTGCTPEPLMSYLKALGVLRVVNEQADTSASGFWRGGNFVVRSNLERSGLIDFFLNRYEPTPIVAPWGARSGFFGGSSERSARDALNAIENTAESRFENFREVVKVVKSLLARLGLNEKASDEAKLRLLRVCRAELPDDVLGWLDATYILTSEGRTFPPLLGTGGNEGSGSYVSGFAQQVVECLVRRRHDEALPSCLFGTASSKAHGGQAPGHFSPFSAGGANQGQGMSGQTSTNPWDYLLCLEGACLWSSAAVRKMESGSTTVASFPFTTAPSPVGQGGLAASDRSRPKAAKRDVAEMWLPIWTRPARLEEVGSFLGEGRALRGRKTARTGLDFARAVAELSVDRGVSSFYRQCFLMRNGQSFFATSLGRYEVRSRPAVGLLRQADRWLDAFRRVVSGEKTPVRFQRSLREIEAAIFDYCQHGGPSRFAEILCSLGRAERELVTAEKLKEKVKPIAGLSPDWLRAADDGSVELELALALAGIYDRTRDGIGPIRTDLEPVDAKRWPGWAKSGKADVWNGADLPTNLVAVLERRLMDASRKGSEAPPFSHRRTASLGAISAFIAGETDDERLEALLWGLLAVDHRRSYPELTRLHVEAPPLPRAFALLRLLFSPRPLETVTGEVSVRPEPALLGLLRAKYLPEACALAMRRLRASGLVPLPHRAPGRPVRDREWSDGAADPCRLAAALLFPVSSRDLGTLMGLVLRPSSRELEAVAH